MIGLGLGCVELGSHRDRRIVDDVRLVRGAIDLGVTVFDTADVYGAGSSEHVLGRALKGRRDDVVLATKGGFVFRERRPVEQWASRRAKKARDVLQTRLGPRATAGSRGRAGGSYATQDFSPLHLRSAVHASLRRLGTDRIDVYQLHGPEQVRPEVIEALADLVAVGDVVRFGVGAGSVEAADGWATVDGVGVLQVPFGVLDPEATASTLPLSRERGIEVWVRGVLGGGLLGAADRGGDTVAAHPKRTQIEAIGRIASASGLDRFELALGFVRARASDVSTVLVGTTSLDHLRHNLDALNAPPLPVDVLGALDELATERA